MFIGKSVWSYKSDLEPSTKFESDQHKLSDCIPDPHRCPLWIKEVAPSQSFLNSSFLWHGTSHWAGGFSTKYPLTASALGLSLAHLARLYFHTVEHLTLSKFLEDKKPVFWIFYIPRGLGIVLGTHLRLQILNLHMCVYVCVHISFLI